MRKRIFSILLLSLVALSAHPESIRLKSGKAVEGKIIERKGGSIRIDFQGIPLTYYLEDIETIDGKPILEETTKPSFHQTSRPLSETEKETLRNQIRTQLKELHYPERTHPALERELLAFFERIDFPTLQSKAQSDKNDPERLKSFLKEISAIFEREGFLARSPRPLIKLLVDSFGDDDMLAVIEESPLSRQEKNEKKSGLYACSAVSQLAGITLKLIGLPVKIVNSTGSISAGGHAANYLRLNSREIILADFLHKTFEVIDLNYWYEPKGKIFALKPRHRLSPEQEIQMYQRMQQGVVPAKTKEILNLLFLTLNLTKTYSASAGIYSNRGLAYGKKNALDRAITDYNQALAINPNYASAYGNRGNAYQKKNALDRAITDYNQALAINPDDAMAYSNRGAAYEHKGDFDRAITDLNQALAINPNDARSCYSRGLAYSSRGDYNNAWEDVRRAQELGYTVNPEFLAELRQATGR